MTSPIEIVNCVRWYFKTESKLIGEIEKKGMFETIYISKTRRPHYCVKKKV